MPASTPAPKPISREQAEADTEGLRGILSFDYAKAEAMVIGLLGLLDWRPACNRNGIGFSDYRCLASLT